MYPLLETIPVLMDPDDSMYNIKYNRFVTIGDDKNANLNLRSFYSSQI